MLKNSLPADNADAAPEDSFDHSALAGGRIPNLDGLRAASILLVLFHHCPSMNWLDTLHANGRYGVALFFVISGFLITTLFLREKRRFGRVDLWRSYGRRCLRLFPLYYVVLGARSCSFWDSAFSLRPTRRYFIEKLSAYLFYYSGAALAGKQC